MAITGRARRRGFRFTVILILTAGIGMHLALAMVGKGMFLTRLPYPESDRLVKIEGWLTDRPETMEALRATSAFERLSQWLPSMQALILSRGSEQQVAYGAYVSPDFLPMLGAAPVLGRFFLPGEYAGGGEKVALISHSTWTQLFRNDPEVVGKEIRLDEAGYTVVGVLPAGFRNLLWSQPSDYWLPYPRDNSRRRIIYAWLKKGVTVEQAGLALQLLAEPLEPRTAEEERLARFPKLTIRTALDTLAGSYRERVLLLFWSSALVFLIACTNAAGLFLVDALKRRREMAIRMALGAKPRAVLSRLFLEYLALFLAGGILGVFLAGWGAKPLLGLVAPYYTRPDVAGLDGMVALYAAGLAAAAGLLFSFLPARAALPFDLNDSLREQGERTGESRGFRRMTGAMVAGQVGLALAILAGAGLLLRTYVTLYPYPSSLGFEAAGKVSFAVMLMPARYADLDQRWRFSETLRQRLESLPFAEEVAVTTSVPFSRSGSARVRVEVPGSPPGSGKPPSAQLHSVTPGYLRFMGRRMLRGRPLAAADTAPDAAAAVINEAATRSVWPDSDPLGKTMTVDVFGTQKTYTVVGIVRDARYSGAYVGTPAVVYVPFRHFPSWYPSFIVKTARPPSGLSKTFQSEVWAVDPTLAIGKVTTIEQFIFRTLQTHSSTLALLGIGAAVALALALVGVYVMISHMVGRRVREIGIRMALGAQPGDIIRMLLRYVGLIVGLGIGLGLVVAWGGTRYLKSLLYGVTPTDPLTLGAVSVALFLAALAACYSPARRASKTDPMEALRYE